MEDSSVSKSKFKEKWKKVRYLNSFLKILFLRNSFNEELVDDTDKTTSCWKRSLRISYSVCTSHFGLIFLLFAYTFIGAGIFHAIEYDPDETDDQQKLEKQRNITINSIIVNISMYIGGNSSNIVDILMQELKLYEENLADENLLYVSTDEHEMFDYWGSALYSLTVYSTIGYGIASPRTTTGKWLTILYGLFGIPLFLVTMADLGALTLKLLQTIARSIKRSTKCNKTTKVGLVEGEKMDTKNIDVNKENDFADVALDLLKQRKQQEEQEESSALVNIFLPVCVSVVYVFAGVGIYIGLEQWSFTDSFYFMFTSLTTIGFGDIYPRHRNYFLISTLYLMLGVALIAMIIEFLVMATRHSLTVAKTKVDSIADRTLGIADDSKLQNKK